MGCLRSNSNYLTFSTNKETSNTINYVKHTRRYFVMDNCINNFHVGRHVCQIIVNYSYAPLMGYLNELKQYSIEYSVNESTIYTNFGNLNMLQSRTIKVSNIEGLAGINKKVSTFAHY